MASYSDSFTYSDGNIATVSSGVWTQGFGILQVLSNQVAGAVGQADSVAYVATGTATFSADQEAQITIHSLGTGDLVGPAVRASSTSCYAVRADGVNSSGRVIGKYASGAWSSLGTVRMVPAAGDTIKIRVVGTTITSYLNGTLVDTVTDSSLTSGQPGVYYNNGNIRVTRGDNFVAADIATGLTITSVNTTNTAFSAQTNSSLVGTGLSASVVCTYAGIACTNESASSSTSLKITFPNFFTNNIKLGRDYEFKVVG